MSVRSFQQFFFMELDGSLWVYSSGVVEDSGVIKALRILASGLGSRPKASSLPGSVTASRA